MKKLWIIVLLFALQAQAQWVNDPSANTIINNDEGTHYISKVTVNPDGTYYFSWWGGPTNINMNLTLFDHDGEAIWNEALLVSSFPQNSWIDDYTLASDHEGNAIIVFSDIRNNAKNVVAYKIDAEGNQLWGEDGILLPVAQSDDYNPKLVVNEDNDAYVTFSTSYLNGNSSIIIVHKIHSDGTLEWGTEGKTYSGFGVALALPTIIANDDGGFSIGFYKETGSFPGLTRNLAMLRCDADGNQLWMTDVTNTGGISPWAKLELKSDNNGGAYFVWDDDRYMDNMAESYAQYINGNGDVLWTENGVLLSQEAGYFQYYAIPAGTNNQGDFIVFWNKVDNSQNHAALMYQRINPQGELLETNYGKTIIAINNQLQNGVSANQMGDTTYFMYNFLLPGSAYLNSYNVIAIDNQGNNVWGQAIELANNSNDKQHPNMSVFNQNQAVVCWSDNTDLGYRTMAQNFYIDGALGHSTVGINDNIINEKITRFVNYNSLNSNLYLKEIQSDDMVIIYDLQGRIVYWAWAKNHMKLELKNKAMYIGVIKRKGIVINQFKLIH